MNQMLDRGLTNRDASLFFEKIGWFARSRPNCPAGGKHSTIKPPTKGEKGRTHLACKLAASLWYGSSFPYLLVTSAPSRSSIWHDEHEFLFREMTATVALIRRCKPNSTFVLGVVIVSIDCDGESFTRKYLSRAQKSFILRLQEIKNKLGEGISTDLFKELLLPLIWTYLTMYLVECLCCIRV